MEFSPLRKAAIRLACTHTEDREWILAQLEPGERRQIDELLEEIHLLGLTSDPGIVAAVMSELTAASSAVGPSADSARLQALLAKAEHPFWAALVLQLETPALRREVLGGVANSTGIRRWDSAFSRQTLPPALVGSLNAYLGGE
ncbi:hypothetical protein [Pseudomonas gingeri]|uniref:Uncharacterized protein n=1 Tax=Pseudomonas gingeri TaxID=117681 RepID=A0A7Y7WBP8_9PSED|nr:hypothetical protein [Pseudomonas gingeri]NWB46413.1 hypothetical protein [Pseudomonas gingeri]